MMKWKKFELSKFINFLFDDKVLSTEEKYSQINNDFSDKFLKNVNSYYECRVLVYFHNPIPGVKQNRFVYFYGDFQEEDKFDDSTKQRYLKLKNIECYHLNGTDQSALQL